MKEHLVTPTTYEELTTDYKAAFFRMSTLLLQAHAYKESGNDDKCKDLIDEAKRLYESIANTPRYVIK